MSYNIDKVNEFIIGCGYVDDVCYLFYSFDVLVILLR